MDLSAYYKDFESTVTISLIVVILTLFTVIFCFIRTLKDKNTPLKKALFCLGYSLIFFIVLGYFLQGPYLYKMDVDEKTICGYEGTFEITKIDDGIYNYAVFVIDDKEIRLKFFSDDGYDAEKISVGKHEGKIIYAAHAEKVLYIEIKHNCAPENITLNKKML